MCLLLITGRTKVHPLSHHCFSFLNDACKANGRSMPGTMFQLLRGSWVATGLSQKHLGEQTRIVSVEIRAFSHRLLEPNSAYFILIF